MSNRTNSAVSEALDARRAITAELRERLQELPASPFDWNCFEPGAALRAGEGSIDLRLVTLSRMLCSAPARSAELRALWNESVVTAAFALGVAPHLGADPKTSAVAGLLHRLGDMLIIDNRSAMHKTGFDYDHSQHRRLYRILVRGDRPY